jgi:hypothetical protein
MAVASVLDNRRLELPSKMARERRELERAIAGWEDETRRLGHEPTLMTLDPAAMVSESWSHRFIIAVEPVVENWGFLFYGNQFSALLDLPVKAVQSAPLIQQLSARFVPVFTKGCTDATALGVPVRMQGAVERGDGRRELYRAAFICFRVSPNGLLPLVFGAFNCRVTDQQDDQPRIAPPPDASNAPEKLGSMKF